MAHVKSTTQCQSRRDQWSMTSLLCIIDKAMKRCVKPHHVHISRLLAYFYLNCVLNGNDLCVLQQFSKVSLPVTAFRNSLFTIHLYLRITNSKEHCMDSFTWEVVTHQRGNNHVICFMYVINMIPIGLKQQRIVFKTWGIIWTKDII